MTIYRKNEKQNRTGQIRVRQMQKNMSGEQKQDKKSTPFHRTQQRMYEYCTVYFPTHAVLIRTEAIGKTGTGGQGDGERQDRTSGELRAGTEYTL